MLLGFRILALIALLLQLSNTNEIEEGTYLWKNDKKELMLDNSHSIIKIENDSIFIYELPTHPSGYINHYASKYKYDFNSNIIEATFNEVVSHSGNNGAFERRPSDISLSAKLIGEVIFRELIIKKLQSEGDRLVIIDEPVEIKYHRVENIYDEMDEVWERRFNSFKKVFSIYYKKTSNSGE